MNQAVKKIAKKFIKGGWAIGYREVDENSESNPTKKPSFTMILPCRNEWYADPFPVIYQGDRFIFAEIMDEKTHRGHIGVIRIGDESKQFIPIIREPFHMSFPNVFFANHEWYMIPETNQAKQMRLYHAKRFPYDWELDCVLLDGAFVDTVMFRESENDFLLETRDVNNRGSEYNRFYRFHTQTKELVEIQPPHRKFIDRRPGGNFITDCSKTIHVLQNCDRMYGEYMHMAVVKHFDERGLEEEEAYTVHAREINCDKKRPYIKTHTYNRWGTFETVDLFYFRPRLQF